MSVDTNGRSEVILFTDKWEPRRHVFFVLALNDIPDPLVRSVQCTQAVQIMHNRSKHKRWAHRRKGEIRALLLDEIPRRSLGECLAGSIGVSWIFDSLLFRDCVPIAFRVSMVWPRSHFRVEDRGKRGRHHDSLDRRRILLDRLQDAGPRAILHASAGSGASTGCNTEAIAGQ